MSVEIDCPKCSKRYFVPAEKIGKPLKCKQCSQSFTAGESGSGPAPSAASTVLSMLGRFEVKGKLGAGAFGTVYRAHDPQLDREVALKVPNAGTLSDAKRVERFLREAKAAANLRHPHIVPVFDAGKDGGNYYIASAFIDGKTLSAAIPEGGMEFPRAARIVRELAEALAYAHEQGVIHRDVKPSNMMMDTHDRVHLMDFGLAVRQEEEARLTNDGTVMGTPAYMSPEQARGQTADPQPATDQYAAGVVLYELLTGAVPFKGRTPVVVHNVIHTEPDPPRKHRASVPKDLETICLKALSKKPEDRYPNCQALADDLRRWVEGEPITARRMGLLERAVRWVRKEPKLTAAVAVVAVALLVSVAVVSTAARQAERDAATARTAGQHAENALEEARQAREREVQAAGTTLGALGTAAEERKRAEAFQSQFADAHERANVADARAAEAQTQVETIHTTLGAGWASLESAIAFQPVVDRYAVQSAYDEFRSGRVDVAQKTLRAIPAARRGWEWYHVDQLSAAPAGSPAVTTKEFNNAVFDRSTGRILASEGSGLHVWDARTGAEIALLKSSSSCHPIAFSPDGSRVVINLGSRGPAIVWDLAAGRTLYTLETGREEVYRAAFSPDGKRLFTSGSDGVLRVWDATTGKGLRVLKGRTYGTSEAAFSPDGGLLVTTGRNSDARVWDVSSGEEIRSFDKVDSSGYSSVAFSADGTKIQAAYYSGAKLWDAKTGTELLLPVGTGSFAEPLARSADGKQFITGLGSWGVQIWDAQKWAPLLRNKIPGLDPKFAAKKIDAAAFSADGQRFAYTCLVKDASKESAVFVCETAAGKELYVLWGHSGIVRAIKFSPDSTRIATIGEDVTVRIWDAATGRLLLCVREASSATDLFWSPDGTKLSTYSIDYSRRLNVYAADRILPAVKP